MVNVAEITLGVGVALVRGAAVPAHRLDVVLRHALAQAVARADAELNP